MDTSPYLSLFLQEMRDNAAKLATLFVELEKDAANQALLQEIMRLSHSCKGVAATMGYQKIAELCHALEDIFDAARKNSIAITSGAIDVCLQALDMLESALAQVEKEKTEPASFAVIETLHDVLEGKEAASAKAAVTVESVAQGQTELPHVRVESKKLDTLLDLAGELSILRLQFAELAAQSAFTPFLQPLTDRFAKLSDELSYQISQSRLVPLDQVFARFPRLVRDLARDQGKKVSFTMTGTSMELDKTLVDQLTAPLVHLLRNAVDHGIEPPDERRNAGKNEEATITLSVRREMAFAVISVEDDGAVIEAEALKAAARQKGFTEDELAEIRQENVLDLLCSARFSSSSAVSMVSGRGVGLSAVRSIVQGLGGQLTLTQSGGRKRFTISLPLQISVIRVLLTKVGGSTYAFPFLHLERLHQLLPGDIRTSINLPAALIDGQEVPLVFLSELFTGKAVDCAALPAVQVLLASHGGRRVGICVDEVLHNEEIMVKPITQALAQLHCFSGYTILGDGRVSLVLDVPGLLQQSAAFFSSR